jgi:hypothetical protein
MIVQLDPPIALETPKGSATAYLVISDERGLMWQAFLEDSGESHVFSNREVFQRKKAAKAALRDEEKRDAFYTRMKIGNFVV